jgi:nitrate reductase alpha subunit
LVHRDYAHLIDQMTTLGPLAEESIVTKGIKIDGHNAIAELREKVGESKQKGIGLGRPSLWTGRQAAEAILSLSGPSNGHRAIEEWQALEKVTGMPLVQAVHGREDTTYRFEDLTVQPRLALPAPVWSGLEGEGRRYSPFTANVELKIPWRTITGRQHFYLDHEVMLDYGEGFPIYRPPVDNPPFASRDERDGVDVSGAVTVRYLTPHQKWGIHSTYADTPRMLSLFRGGQTVWMSVEDARSIGVKDNDWIEVFNRNGAIVARAVISHRIPQGIALMYHAQDRTIGIPQSRVTKDRGGTHNSVTRIIPKGTHMIGAYAQLSYSMNYYGPTGHQRDVMTWIRPLKEVDWLED